MARREAFLEEQASLDANKLIFLDECSISTALNHRYGWAPAGERVVLHAPVRGTRRTMVGAIALDGRRALDIIEKGLRIPSFIEYVRNRLVPILRPGDIVVMDNLKIHRNAEAIELIEKAGATVLFQPPYSPEFNAIEFCWGWIKHRLRRIAARNIDSLITYARDQWEAVTPELCRAWIRGCGYAALECST